MGTSDDDSMDEGGNASEDGTDSDDSEFSDSEDDDLD